MKPNVNRIAGLIENNPKKMTIPLGESLECGGCFSPLFGGEVYYIGEGQAIGCCLPCCRDAEGVKRDVDEVKEYRKEFELVRPENGKPRGERFADNVKPDGEPLKQSVLFTGSRLCLPGQGDLFKFD